MPLSTAAEEAVRTVAGRYPNDAQRLLDMLRAAPEAARRKPTRFGPLNVALLGNPPLTADETRLCEDFAAEWLRGEFDVVELADVLEAALGAMGRRQDPLRHRPGGWRTLAGGSLEPGRLFGGN